MSSKGGRHRHRRLRDDSKGPYHGYTVAPVLRELPYRPRLQVISGRDRKRVSRAALAYGFQDEKAQREHKRGAARWRWYL